MALRMVADRTTLGRFGGLNDIPALETFPVDFAILDEEFVMLQGVMKFVITRLMPFFDHGDMPEGLGDIRETFLVCNIRE